jgi:2-polyprenyl-3-methyl-5-hydroxy-6-metoxy-1,4-benzoquinol methylase
MFNKNYFENFSKYGEKEADVKLSYFEVLKWANKRASYDLFDGKGKKALDVGCGYGYVVDMLGSFGYSIFGVDVSSHALRWARAFLSRKSRGVTLVLGDVQKPLPFNIKFDLITCFEVLEHLSDPLSAIANIRDLLKPNGIVVARTPNKYAVYSRRFLDRDSTHINVKSYAEWKKIFSELNPESSLRMNCYTWIPIPSNNIRRFLKVNLIGGYVYVTFQKGR